MLAEKQTITNSTSAAIFENEETKRSRKSARNSLLSFLVKLYWENSASVVLLQKIVIISISLKSCQHFTEPNEKKGAEEKEELTFLLLLMCTTKVVEVVNS